MNADRKISGTLFIVGIVQFILALSIAPALHPGYSLSEFYISDLGIGPYAAVFNLSAVTLGLVLLAGVFFLRQQSELKPISNLLFFVALAIVAVGVFTKDFTVVHGVVASLAFFLSAIAAFTSTKLLKKAPSLVSIVLGALTMVALALFSIGMVSSGSITSTVAYNSVFYLGLGPGGMESMVIVPSLIWLALFSVCLITEKGFKKE